MDKTQAVLSQYDITPQRMKKGRGILILETEEGLLQLKEYTGPKERLTVQDELLKSLSGKKEWNVERILPNKEGCLYSLDPDKRAFLLLTLAEGKECNVTDKEECLVAASKLQKLHENMYLPEMRTAKPYHFQDEVEKHTRDMARARKFIRSRKHFSEFELELLHLYDHFGMQADFVNALCRAEDLWEYEKNEAEKGSICHGDCQYHNILLNGRVVSFTGFEKWCYDVHIRDFYRFFRKIMEKNQWNQELGFAVLHEYEKQGEVPIPAKKLLFLHLCFPEKYWKIMNYYLNSRKSYISERNIEKCKALVKLENQRLAFLEQLIMDIYPEGEYNRNIRYFR